MKKPRTRGRAAAKSPELPKHLQPLPDNEWPFGKLKRKHYRVIHFDPPTKFWAGTKGRPQHYKRLTDREIAEQFPIRELAHPDGAVVMFWATTPKTFRAVPRPIDFNKILPNKLATNELAYAMGATFSSSGFIWVKLNKKLGNLSAKPLFVMLEAIFMSSGYTTRKNIEICWIFRLGAKKLKRLRKDVREVIVSPLREHSRKPEEVYERIMQLYPGPYCDVFARKSRPGWDTWGNESTKFDIPAAPRAPRPQKKPKPTTQEQENMPL